MRETAYFAAGCFWGIEAAFLQVPGVISAESGYMGGDIENPSYQQVCSGTTGHAEAVKVEFDPQEVSYQQLLDVFWRIHDPTQMNRQGPDIGTQYRSAIFAASEEQEALARQDKERLNNSGAFARPIVTDILDARHTPFWKAEEYHQRYFEKHGVACHLPL